MSYHNASSTLHSSIQSLLDDFLTLFVKSASCFVQNDDLWRFNECACDSNSLFLTARKLASLETTNLLETCVKLIFGSFDFVLVNEQAESFTVEAFNSCSVVLQEHAKNFLSSTKGLARFETLAIVNDCLEIKFTFVLVQTSNDLLAILIGNFLGINIFDFYSAHKELLNLFNLRLEFERFHNLQPSTVLFNNLRLERQKQVIKTIFNLFKS